MLTACRFESAWGIGLVVASEAGIARVVLPHEGNREQFRESGLAALPPSPLAESVARRLQCYFDGNKQGFDDIQVDLSAVTPFRASILTLIRSIPYGMVMSYGEVAALAGRPSAARAIGGAMASNPVPLIIPCHRVIAANGSLTGFSASGGLMTKRKMLQLEGVEFVGEKYLQKNV